MGNVLYKSKGVPTALLALKTFLFLIFTILGGFFAIRSAQNNRVYEYFGTSNSEHTMTMWLGYIMIIAGIAFLIEAIVSNSQCITVYDNRIEGVVCKGGLVGAFQKISFDLQYNQITNVQIVKKGAFDYLEIIAQSQSYKVAVKGNVNEAYNIIYSKINK